MWGQAAGPDSLLVLRCPEQAECPCQRVMAARQAPAHSFCSSGNAHAQLWATSTQMPLLLTHPTSVCLAYHYPPGHCCPPACWFPPTPWCPLPCQCPAAHQRPLAPTAQLPTSSHQEHCPAALPAPTCPTVHTGPAAPTCPTVHTGPASAHLPHGAHWRCSAHLPPPHLPLTTITPTGPNHHAANLPHPVS